MSPKSDRISVTDRGTPNPFDETDTNDAGSVGVELEIDTKLSN